MTLDAGLIADAAALTPEKYAACLARRRPPRP